ncbi:MAG: ATP-binding protein [Rubrimonas sp.]
MTPVRGEPEGEEALRDALAQMAHLRAGERAALRRAEAVIAALSRMAAAPDPAAALDALLAALRETFACDAAALLIGEGASARVAALSPAALGWTAIPGAGAALDKPRRLADAAEAGWRAPDGGAPPFLSVALAPVATPATGPAALACLDRRRAAFAAADGALLGQLAAFAQQALAAQALSARNAMLAAAVEHAEDGIAVTDSAGRFLYMSPAHCALFGFASEAEALRRDWRDLYDPAQAAMIETVAFPALGAAGWWRGEAVGRRRDGGAVHQELTLTALKGGGIVCVTRDIGPRRAAEAERARLLDLVQIAQRREAVGLVASGVAHDFNNLLSAIGGSAALAGHELAVDHPAYVHLRRIGAAAASASTLVNRLLDLGARRGPRRPVDLRAQLREAMALVAAGLPDGVTLTVEIGDAPLIARVDPTDVLQVALNLALNARDAVAGLGGAVRASLGAAPAQALEGPCRLGALQRGRAYARLVVADDGIGMDAAEAARIFEPYFTTKGVAGTGLGLPVVAGVLAAYGAALRLETALGEGAAFTIFWPLDDSAGAADLTGLAVIAVDDDPQALAAIAAALEAHGAEVAPCEHPEDALAAISEAPDAWAALVTDHDMPGMTGAELARAARRAAPGLPVALCTGLEPSRALAADAAALFDAVLRKPVDGATLAEALAAACARRGPEAPTEARAKEREGDADPAG